MPISQANETAVTVLTKAQKDKLRLVAQRHHRSLSKEIAYVLELYLEDFDDEGGHKRPEQNKARD